MGESERHTSKWGQGQERVPPRVGGGLGRWAEGSGRRSLGRTEGISQGQANNPSCHWALLECPSVLLTV